MKIPFSKGVSQNYNASHNYSYLKRNTIISIFDLLLKHIFSTKSKAAQRALFMIKRVLSFPNV